MTRPIADLMLLLAAAVWGSAFVFQKTAMHHLEPATFIAARAALAALTLAPFAWWEARNATRAAAPGMGPAAAAAGLAFFAGAVLQQVGLIDTTVTNTGFLTGLYVVATPLLAWLAFGQRPAGRVTVAILLAFTGTWALGGGTLPRFGSGEALIAFSALCWAAHLLIVGRAARHARPFLLTALQFAVVALLGALGAWQFESPTLSALWAARGQILYVGILSSALTFTLLAAALRYTSPGEAAILVSTEALFAAAAGAWWLGERLSPLGTLGAVLLLGASLLVQIGPRTPATPPAPDARARSRTSVDPE